MELPAALPRHPGLARRKSGPNQVPAPAPHRRSSPNEQPLHLVASVGTDRQAMARTGNRFDDHGNLPTRFARCDSPFEPCHYLPLVDRGRGVAERRATSDNLPFRLRSFVLSACSRTIQSLPPWTSPDAHVRTISPPSAERGGCWMAIKLDRDHSSPGGKQGQTGCRGRSPLVRLGAMAACNNPVIAPSRA